MNKSIFRVMLVLVIAISLLGAAVYAEDPLLPESVNKLGAGRAMDKVSPTDNELLSNPDAYIPGITDVFKPRVNTQVTDSVSSEQVPAQPTASTVSQPGHGKYNILWGMRDFSNPPSYFFPYPPQLGQSIVKNFELVRDGSGSNGVQYLRIVKNLDLTSHKLLFSSLDGGHLSEGTLTVYKSGSNDQELLKIKLYDMQVISYKLAGDEKNPTEAYDEVCFSFARIGYEIPFYKPDGTVEVFKYDYNIKSNELRDMSK